MNNKHIFIYFVCIFALIADTSKAALKNTNFLIVPGHSIGEVKLHATPDHLTTILAKPIAGDMSMGRLTYCWNVPSDQAKTKSHLDVLFHRDAEGKHYFAVQIRVNSKKFSTVTDIIVGKSLREIEKFFPNIQRIDPDSKLIIYDSFSKGIAFEFNDQMQCCAIIIHRPSIKVIPMF